MSISTFSTFIYGHYITNDNYAINFNEGSGELLASVAVGSYTVTDFASQVELSLNSAGTFTYTVTYDRDTRKITIASVSGNFDLLITSGTQSAVSTFALLGYTGADVTGAATYTGDSDTGSEYQPQFKLQDYISSEDWRAASLANVNKSASGRVEVVKFGDEQFVQGNIKYATDIAQPDALVIKNNVTGVANLRVFMRYIVNKRPIEFVADLVTTATFEKVILESSPDFKDGTGYKLKELYSTGLPGYYETGPLVFRVIA